MRIIPNVVSNQDVVTLPQDSTTREAIQIMMERHISAVLVVDDRGDLVGIVTERDITHCFANAYMDADNELLADIMTPRPITVEPHDSAEDALEMMEQRHIRHLPVMEGDRIVGIVSIRDLFAAVRNLIATNAKHMESYIMSEEEGTAGG